jgi:hypothetical protein
MAAAKTSFLNIFLNRINKRIVLQKIENRSREKGKEGLPCCDNS